MNKPVLCLVLIIASFFSLNAQSKTYFVSSEGNDINAGTSINAPWKTIDKVNEVIFQPGDAILFQSGGLWHGNLRPQGNGEPGAPITLGSYGKGSMPMINMGDKAGVGIHLVNQSWWEIIGIEVTSGAPFELGIWRRGIVAEVKGVDNTIEHIVIKDCYVHDIWGHVGGDDSGMGIYVGQIILGKHENKNCKANDILVENNTIERVDKVGIAIIGNNDVFVRRNHLDNIGGDGIVVFGTYKGLIEYNIANKTCMRSGDPDLDTGGETWWPHTAAIWLWRCTETIMQFNEVYNTGRQPGNNDGQAYDFDFGCERCILQYNYSENNYGFLLVMNLTKNNIARYNISQNDKRHLVLAHGNVEDGNLIHNNVFYVDHSTIKVDYHGGSKEATDSIQRGITFKNNIFYATGQGRFRAGGSVFSHNCYFGPWKDGNMPGDPNGILADPMFFAPGTGGIGISSLKGYKLKKNSPCIDTGDFIEMNGNRDFYGNPVKYAKVNIGVYQHKGH